MQFFLPHNRDSNTSVYSFNKCDVSSTVEDLWLAHNSRLLCTSNPPQVQATTLRFQYGLFLPHSCGEFHSILFAFIMLNVEYNGNPSSLIWLHVSKLPRTCVEFYTSFAGYNIIIGSIKSKLVLLSLSLLHRWLNPWQFVINNNALIPNATFLLRSELNYSRHNISLAPIGSISPPYISSAASSCV